MPPRYGKSLQVPIRNLQPDKRRKQMGADRNIRGSKTKPDKCGLRQGKHTHWRQWAPKIKLSETS